MKTLVKSYEKEKKCGHTINEVVKKHQDIGGIWGKKEAALLPGEAVCTEKCNYFHRTAWATGSPVIQPGFYSAAPGEL